MSARHVPVPLMIRIRHWISGARPAMPEAPVPPTWSPPGPYRTLLFVYVDGVLHRAQNGSFEFPPNLLRILRLRPDVDVVISSSWRVNATREWLLDHFPPSSHDRIVGVTPVRAGPYQHQAECLSFAHAVGATANSFIPNARGSSTPIATKGSTPRWRFTSSSDCLI